MSTIPISSSHTPHITSLDSSSPGGELASVAVQSERMRLINMELTRTIRQIESRKAQIGKLSNVMVHLQEYASQIKGNDATSKPEEWTNDKFFRYEILLYNAIREARIRNTDLGFSDTPAGVRSKLDSNGRPTGDRIGSISRGEIDAAIIIVNDALRVEINALQMDMLQLQKLHVMRAEATIRDAMDAFNKRQEEQRARYGFQGR